MTQTPIGGPTPLTDPGDIREAYERSPEFSEAAFRFLAEEQWDDLPPFLQEAIGKWYSGTSYCEQVVFDLVEDARTP